MVWIVVLIVVVVAALVIWFCEPKVQAQ